MDHCIKKSKLFREFFLGALLLFGVDNTASCYCQLSVVHSSVKANRHIYFTFLNNRDYLSFVKQANIVERCKHQCSDGKRNILLSHNQQYLVVLLYSRFFVEKKKLKQQNPADSSIRETY